MGRIYQRLGFPNEARPRLEEALEIRRATPGVAQDLVAASLSNLGYLLIELGEPDPGVDLLDESIEIRRQHDPDDQESLTRTLTALARGLEEQGLFARAEPIYRRLLEERREQYGAESESYARGLNNLAVALLRRGKLEEAGKLFGQALGLWRSLEGTESVDYAMTEVGYAVLLDARGDYRSAIRRHRHAIGVRRSRYGESSLVMARGYGALAFSLLGTGSADELAEAEILLRLAIGTYEAQQQPRHPHVLVFQRNLAATLIARGDPQGAEALAREVMELSLEELSPGHWRVADARSVLGHAKLAQGHVEDAGKLLTESLPVIREATGDSSRYTREARERLALLPPG